jgi:ADP-heptose:LPS heptosyltransferase
MFLISGLLMHLRKCWPDVEIHIFHGTSNAAAVPMLPVDVVAHRCQFKRPWQVISELQRAKLDLLVNCAPWARLTAIVAALSGARSCVGFRSNGQHIHYAYDLAVDYSPTRHEVENHLALAQCFGPLERYSVATRFGEPSELADLIFDRTVLLHMFAGGSRARQKSWPAPYWVALAQRLIEVGWVVGFTGSAGDASAVQQLIAEARLPPDYAICLAGRLSLPQLAYVITRVPLLVTIDTGIAHLAAAVDGAVVGLHGPTSFERWGACHGRASGLNASHSAAGYIHYGFEQHPLGDEVMACLSVDEVFLAVMARLQLAVSPAKLES